VIELPPGSKLVAVKISMGCVSHAEAFEIAREAAREQRLRRDALGPAGLAWEDYGCRWAQMVSGDRA